MERIGYKGFKEKDGKLYCLDMEYKVGEIAEVRGEPKICEHGIHFCWNLNDVHEYYNLRNSVICEVEPLGEVVADTDGKKCCTNKLKVVRMLTKEEVLKISNTGNDNTGYGNIGNSNTGDHNVGRRNTGDCNTGDFNTGDFNAGDYNTGNHNVGRRNTGDCNTGDYNTGDYNTGDYNVGRRNAGDCNTGDFNAGDFNAGDYNTGDHNVGRRNTGDFNAGDYNTGDHNIGNRNTGDFNMSDCNTGFFNTTEPKCYIFDKPSTMTMTEFRNSIYYKALNSSIFPLCKWVLYTEEEKAQDKAKACIGGYLKSRTFKEAAAIWWANMSDKNKKVIMKMPNFDAEKFEKITGIKVENKING